MFNTDEDLTIMWFDNKNHGEIETVFEHLHLEGWEQLP